MLKDLKGENSTLFRNNTTINFGLKKSPDRNTKLEEATKTHMTVSSVNVDKEAGILPLNWLSERKLKQYKKLCIIVKTVGKTTGIVSG